MGARQVGKTTLLKQFGESEYKQYIYLNFEERPALKLLFQSNLTPDRLLKAISLETSMTIEPHHTLIIFDEIQECPEALNSLKYFQEQASNYHICAAGSLLGVKLAQSKGFPVGKVNFLNLYPFSFAEFLEAIGKITLKNYIETFDKIEPLAENVHQKLLNYFKIYLFIGGMPEAISEYIDSGDFSKVRNIQTEILKAYDLDFAKHAPKNILNNISLVWHNIPSQLAKENKKFIYSTIRKGARAKDFESAIQWLHEAGLVHKVLNITTPKIPLDAYTIFDFFKIYLVDVGLLGAMVHLNPKTILYGDQLFKEFQGSLIENYVTQALVNAQYQLYYWTSEGKAEVDFILQQEQQIFPLEVKSGYSDKKKSLRTYANKYNPPRLLRSSPMNLKQDGDVLNCPLYLISELNRLLNLT
jgi:predicted AAA+ superfamily ATPase